MENIAECETALTSQFWSWGRSCRGTWGRSRSSFMRTVMGSVKGSVTLITLMSRGSRVSKVTIWVKILKLHCGLLLHYGGFD